MNLKHVFIFILLLSCVRTHAQGFKAPTTENTLDPLSLDLQWMAGISNSLNAKQGLKQANKCLTDVSLENPLCALLRYLKSHQIAEANVVTLFTEKIVYVGEQHLRTNAKKFLTQNLKSLKDAGYTTLAMEMWNSSSQNYVDQFLLGLVDPKLFETNFHQQWSYDSAAYMELMSAAKNLDMQILALDSRDKLDTSKPLPLMPELAIRDEYMAEQLAIYIKANPDKKVIVFCGKLHAYTHITTDSSQLSQIEILFNKSAVRAQSVIMVGSQESTPSTFAIGALNIQYGVFSMTPKNHFMNLLIFTSEL